MKILINSISYTGNGSRCEGFHRVHFGVSRSDLKNLVAIAFVGEPKDCIFIDQLAIINLDNPTDFFPATEFEPLIRGAITQWENTFSHENGNYMQKFPFKFPFNV